MESTRILLLLVLLSIVVNKVNGFGGFHFADEHQHNTNMGVQTTLEDDADLYEILGIDEEASIRDVKKAFRRLSMQHHPDKNPDDPEAVDKFRRISDAYEVLSHEEHKFLYDQGGMSMVKQSADEKVNGAGDILSAFFGGGQQKSNRGENTELKLVAELQDFYIGTEKQVSHTRRVLCRGCAGSKGKSKERCRVCKRCPKELKMVQKQMAPGFFVQQQEEVRSKEKCKIESKGLDVTIEKGMKSGERITFKYMAEQKPKQIPGDVLVIIEQKPHHLFERKGDNLHHRMKITLKESLIGFVKQLTHLDGHIVMLDSRELKDSIIKPYEVITIKNEGMPIHEVPSQFGDLHVTFEIIFPTHLTETQTASIATLF